MTSTEKKTLVNGPSREALIDAFKYAYDRRHPHEVVFVTEGGAEVSIAIKVLRHDDGSGNSFIFEGNVKSVTRNNVRSNVGRSNSVVGYFNTRSRNGWMQRAQ